MGECAVCGVSMQSPCGIICLSDCSVCWATVIGTDESHDAAGPVIQIKLNGDKPVPMIDARTTFRICTSGVKMADVAALIDHLHPSATVSVPASVPASRGGIEIGTLDELIGKIGLLSSPSGA
ncbi:MAG: hypothetical protein ABI697_00235 [Devosia sp.]